MTLTLELDVAFDPERTDGESLAAALDRLLETALSTPGIFEEYGPVQVGLFRERLSFRDHQSEVNRMKTWTRKEVLKIVGEAIDLFREYHEARGAEAELAKSLALDEVAGGLEYDELTADAS